MSFYCTAIRTELSNTVNGDSYCKIALHCSDQPRACGSLLEFVKTSFMEAGGNRHAKHGQKAQIADNTVFALFRIAS